MPRTAVFVLPSQALVWLKNNGFVHPSTSRVRLEIRAELPPVIYTDGTGDRQPTGSVQTAEQIRDWLYFNGVIPFEVRGLYIDCPEEIVDMTTMTARGVLTDKFTVQQVLDFLTQVGPTR